MQVSSQNKLNSNLWHKISISYDGTVGSLYVDGVLDATSNTQSGNSSDILTAPYNPTISVASNAGSHSFNPLAPTWGGRIKAIAIYNQALSADQIASLGLPSVPANGLVALYDFGRVDWAAMKVTDQVDRSKSLDLVGF